MGEEGGKRRRGERRKKRRRKRREKREGGEREMNISKALFDSYVGNSLILLAD